MELFGTSYAANASLARTKERVRRDISSTHRHVCALASQHAAKKAKFSMLRFAHVFSPAKMNAFCLLS